MTRAQIYSSVSRMPVKRTAWRVIFASAVIGFALGTILMQTLQNW